VSTATSERQAIFAFHQFIFGLNAARSEQRRQYTKLRPGTHIPASELNRAEVLRVFLILNKKHEPHRASLNKVGHNTVHLSDELWGEAKLRSESIVAAVAG
jgi:hypothetical protein